MVVCLNGRRDNLLLSLLSFRIWEYDIRSFSLVLFKFWNIYIVTRLDAVAESCGRSGFLQPGRVKQMTYKIDTCRYLASLVLNLTWCLALLGYGKDWLAQYHDNVTEWEIASWCWQPGVTVGQHYEVIMSVHHHNSVPSLIRLYVFQGCNTAMNSNNILTVWLPRHLDAIPLPTLICIVYVVFYLWGWPLNVARTKKQPHINTPVRSMQTMSYTSIA